MGILNNMRGMFPRISNSKTNYKYSNQRYNSDNIKRDSNYNHYKKYSSDYNQQYYTQQNQQYNQHYTTQYNMNDINCESVILELIDMFTPIVIKKFKKHFSGETPLNLNDISYSLNFILYIRAIFKKITGIKLTNGMSIYQGLKRHKTSIVSYFTIATYYKLFQGLITVKENHMILINDFYYNNNDYNNLIEFIENYNGKVVVSSSLFIQGYLNVVRYQYKERNRIFGVEIHQTARLELIPLSINIQNEKAVTNEKAMLYRYKVNRVNNKVQKDVDDNITNTSSKILNNVINNKVRDVTSGEIIIESKTASMNNQNNYNDMVDEVIIKGDKNSDSKTNIKNNENSTDLPENFKEIKECILEDEKHCERNLFGEVHLFDTK